MCEFFGLSASHRVAGSARTTRTVGASPEAAVESRLYGFVDEVAIRVRPKDSGSIVDVRSRSRLGRIDRGVNAKRIRALLADLRQAGG